MHHHSSEWSASFSVGNDHIDNQHQEIFEVTHMLDDAINIKHSRDSVGKIVEYLEHYVDHHFPEEEALMKACPQKLIDYHQREHEILTMYVHNIGNHFRNSQSTTHTIFLIRQFTDRLIHHIECVDTLLTPYLKGQK